MNSLYQRDRSRVRVEWIYLGGSGVYPIWCQNGLFRVRGTSRKFLSKLWLSWEGPEAPIKDLPFRPQWLLNPYLLTWWNTTLLLVGEGVQSSRRGSDWPQLTISEISPDCAGIQFSIFSIPNAVLCDQGCCTLRSTMPEKGTPAFGDNDDLP